MQPLMQHGFVACLVDCLRSVAYMPDSSMWPNMCPWQRTSDRPTPLGTYIGRFKLGFAGESSQRAGPPHRHTRLR